jgi:hypothetical protein
MIGQTALLHLSPAPHSKTFKVFLIYFPKCLVLSAIKSYAQNVAIHLHIHQTQGHFSGEKSHLRVNVSRVYVELSVKMIPKYLKYYTFSITLI